MILGFFCVGCRGGQDGTEAKAAQPVGVFDSGTGGLTVLEKILSLDAFDNASGAQTPDGVPDFAAEDFQYLADQANMPYGVYDAQGNAALLRRLVLDDACFLLGDRYFQNAGEPRPTGRKAPCKILVIACNTATAYGLNDVKQMLDGQGKGTKVIGVINAGVKAALDALEGEREPFAVGVLATPGTISSGAYERTLRAEIEARGIQTPVTVVNQAGYGFAEAVDSEPDYVNPALTAPRESYRGPRLGTADPDIKEELLDAYNFEPEGLLYRSAGPLKLDLQLNSAANYARFNLVSLVERHRASGSGAPLKAVILGCTHYPFLLETLQRTVAELRDYQENGAYPYRELLAEDLAFIDPARYVAIECYRSLQEDGLLKPAGTAPRSVRGFISVPAASLDPACKTAEGALTFEYKYGRPASVEDPGTRPVPFSDDNIDGNNRARIRALLPACARELFPE
jgi:glutamate racemase